MNGGVSELMEKKTKSFQAERPIIFVVHSLGGLVCAQVGRSLSLSLLCLEKLKVFTNPYIHRRW